MFLTRKCISETSGRKWRSYKGNQGFLWILPLRQTYGKFHPKDETAVLPKAALVSLDSSFNINLRPPLKPRIIRENRRLCRQHLFLRNGIHKSRHRFVHGDYSKGRHGNRDPHNHGIPHDFLNRFHFLLYELHLNHLYHNKQNCAKYNHRKQGLHFYMFHAFFIGPTPTAKGTHGSLLIPPLREPRFPYDPSFNRNHNYKNKRERERFKENRRFALREGSWGTYGSPEN
jgi:hypothetical protein